MDAVSCIAATAGVCSAIAATASAIIAKLVYRSSVDPYVVAYLHIEDVTLYLVVENIGSSPALDVSFKMSGNLTRGDDFASYFGKSFVYKGIPVLMPGYSLKTAVGVAMDYEDECEEAPSISVSFKRRAHGPWKSETAAYPLDWTPFTAIVSTESSRESMEKELTRAAKAFADNARERKKNETKAASALEEIASAVVADSATTGTGEGPR